MGRSLLRAIRALPTRADTSMQLDRSCGLRLWLDDTEPWRVREPILIIGLFQKTIFQTRGGHACRQLARHRGRGSAPTSRGANG
jgi:hypothetical protein